jgi:hypothetical protein
MRTRLVLLLVALGGAAAFPAAAPAQEISTSRATPLREHAGVTVLSRWDGSAYRLAIRSAGGAPVDVTQVRAQARPFDVDIGSDTRGRPALVMSLCDPDCDLFVTSPFGGPVRPVRNANTSDHDESAPTIWRGRIAFARRYGTRDVPYTKELVAPRSRPSTRLAGLPQQRCLSPDPPTCRPIERERIAALEIWGRWVGQSWTYEVNGAGGFRQNEMRLTTIDRRDTRQLAFHVTGLSGQRLLAPSFANGAVAWYLGCNSDTGGCKDRGGATRYGINTRTYARDVETTRLGGWAWDGQFQHRSLEGPAGCTVEESEIAPPAGAVCPLVRAPQPDWQRVDPPRPVT